MANVTNIQCINVQILILRSIIKSNLQWNVYFIGSKPYYFIESERIAQLLNKEMGKRGQGLSIIGERMFF